MWLDGWVDGRVCVWVCVRVCVRVCGIGCEGREREGGGGGEGEGECVGAFQTTVVHLTPDQKVGGSNPSGLTFALDPSHQTLPPTLTPPLFEAKA